ncbi:MAG: M20/M25/M40 family metallo-hydrolase, partial [Myxococcales bacterium]|nr:M20/M25/M40 family metallo-hydrolase [Myxococcales bacterium]
MLTRSTGLGLCLLLAAAGCDDDGGGGGVADAQPPAADAAIGDVEVPAAPSAEVLTARADVATFGADVELVARPRVPGSAHWQAVQDRCAEVFAASGFTVERQAYGSGVNVIGVRPGTTAPGEWVVVSAHYDHLAECAGADDNASGVAGVLEAARALAGTAFERTLVLACWDEEEWGLVGSRAWAGRAKRQGVEVKASYVLDTVGYFSDEPGSQTLPAGFEFIFPEAHAQVAQADFRGDFIAAIADDLAPGPITDLKAGADRVGLRLLPVLLNGPYRRDPSLIDLRRSDHAEFWAVDWPAALLTTTANFRNPAYHCALGEDDIGDVNMERAFQVMQATLFAAATQARPTTGDPGALDTTADPMPPMLACDLKAQDCPDGQKCTFQGFADTFETVCRPAGEVPLGGACVRGQNASFEDCAAGLYCAFFGQPLADPQGRVCHALCAVDTDCPGEQRCVELERTRHVGVCSATCDVLDPAACGAGQVCGVRESAKPGPKVSLCEPGTPGAGQRGDAC